MGKFVSLEKSQLTKNWTVENRAILAHFLERQDLQVGETLFSDQTVERKLYWIDQGEIKLQHGNIVVQLGAGQSFGELSLVAAGKKQTIATALETCRFWVLTEAQWAKLKKDAPAVAFLLLESITQKLSHILSSAPPPPKLSDKLRSGTSPSTTGITV